MSDRLSKMLEKHVKENQVALSESKEKKKQWSVLQKRTIFKLPATHSKHTDTHPCTNTAMRYSFLRGRLPPTGVLRKKKAEFTALWKCPCWDRPGPSSCRLAEARCPRCGPRSRDRPLQGKSCLSFRAFPPAKIRQPLPASLTFFQKTARNKSELPLLPHMEDTGTFCCLSSPFSSFSLQLPPPPVPAEKRTGGHATHRAGPSTFKAPPGGAPLVLARPYSRPAGWRVCFRRLSSQELMLQLLPLAPAACDYLKPQPFIYEKP